MGQKIKLGLFGAGGGRDLASVGQVMPEFEITAVCDSNGGRLNSTLQNGIPLEIPDFRDPKELHL